MSLNQTSHHVSLADLLKDFSDVPDHLNIDVGGMQLDSRKVSQGDLFIVQEADSALAERYIRDALSLGACAVLIDETLSIDQEIDHSKIILVAELKHLIGTLADRFYKAPSQRVSVIGVTGTNGKTSVSNYAASLMSSAGIRSGVIGTLGYGMVGQALTETGYTTPDVVSVHQHLAELEVAGAECVVMEVSSHGLEQGRVDQVQFEGAVFTNLSREHLDYHGSMDQYAAAKCKLFEGRSLKFAVLNGDDQYVEQFKSVLAPSVKAIIYGFSENHDVHVLHVDYQQGISALIQTPVGQLQVNSKLLGHFNLSNLMAVIAIAVAKGLTLRELQAVDQVVAVPGRMQLLQVNGKPAVIIDYAHTPDALENALSALELHCVGDLNVVFGCGGDRDTGKRAEMAAVAEKYAEIIYVTDDNPRSESPEKIVKDIMSGFSDKARVSVIHDRAEAIDRAIEDADQDDWVLIAGKGHETYQEISGIRLPFSDIQIASEKLGLSSMGGAL